MLTQLTDKQRRLHPLLLNSSKYCVCTNQFIFYEPQLNIYSEVYLPRIMKADKIDNSTVRGWDKYFG